MCCECEHVLKSFCDHSMWHRLALFPFNTFIDILAMSRTNSGLKRAHKT